MSEQSQKHKTWRCLMNEYERRLRFTSGCGQGAQYYVDEALEKLKDFAELHPECQEQVPSSEQVQNDGNHGLLEGILAMGRTNNYK